MTGHFLEMASGPGKHHLYCTVACLCILSPSFAFLHLDLLYFLAILLSPRSPARLRWRPSGRLRVHLPQPFLPSIPIASCLSQVTTCLLFLSPTFFTLSPSEFFLRRNFVLGGSAVGHCPDRGHPRVYYLYSCSHPRPCSSYFSFLPRSP
jgi:hypothetical protein